MKPGTDSVPKIVQKKVRYPDKHNNNAAKKIAVGMED